MRALSPVSLSDGDPDSEAVRRKTMVKMRMSPPHLATLALTAHDLVNPP